jgi:hypothetical protein
MVISSSNTRGIGHPCVMSNDYLIENELGYTNHQYGKYITEREATHKAIREDDKTVIVPVVREQLDWG